MLTRDLLRHQITRDRQLIPRFVDADNRLLLDLAGELIDLYSQGAGQTREELDELIQPLLDGARSPLVARGLNKLLQDRCRFREGESESAEALRQRVFAAAARQMRAPGMGDLTAYRAGVAASLGEPSPEALAERLYGDLPHRQPLEGFKPLSAQRLLHRYNMAQAQGPLLWAERMELEFVEDSPSRWRPFFRFLKYLRLMAYVERTGPGGYRILVDGPLSLFYNTQKYGLQLATLLPALSPLSQWRMVARVRMPLQQQSATLTLDQKSGLVSHYTQTHAHLPESHAVFARQFKEAGGAWTILEEAELLNLNGQEVAVPDFTFVHSGGARVHLELFHRWHAGALKRRLGHLDRRGEAARPPLLLGVERHLAKESESAALLEGSAWFGSHGFLYNEFPPLARVNKALEGFLPSLPPKPKGRRGKSIIEEKGQEDETGAGEKAGNPAAGVRRGKSP